VPIRANRTECPDCEEIRTLVSISERPESIHGLPKIPTPKTKMMAGCNQRNKTKEQGEVSSDLMSNLGKFREPSVQPEHPKAPSNERKQGAEKCSVISDFRGGK
jgi:hypothetical protein